MATAAVLRFPRISLTAIPEPPSMHAWKPVRRRTTPQQGRALEVLGHAIEYIVDSRLPEGGMSETEHQAMRILMACSRSVFEASAEVVPVHQRLQGWIEGRWRKRPA